jgi:putative holliday junction resolvase
MPRILCIDWGGKRCGVAVTDPLQIIATGLTTVDTPNIIAFLKSYFATEDVEKILVGEPLNLDDSDTHSSQPVRSFVEKLKQNFPAISVEMVDERYTSRMAKQSMIDSGMRKKDRRNKKLVDEIAATIMLQEYMMNNC